MTTLVAHRGYPNLYPENTLLGITAALKLGAKAVEFDIQLSADHIPIVFHDANSSRLTNKSIKVMETIFDELQSLRLMHSLDINETIGINSLSELVDELCKWSDIEIFVEIKPESIKYFGIQVTIDSVIEVLLPIKKQVVILSYELDALNYVRELGFPIAWVIKNYNDVSYDKLKNLNPDIAVCNQNKIVNKELWQGKWKWMLYTINSISDLKQYADIDYIETDDIGYFIEKL